MKKFFVLFVPGIKCLAHRERFTTVYDFPRGALSLATFLNVRSVPTAVVPLDYHVKGSPDQHEIDSSVLSAVRDAIEEYDPQVVGVSCPYTMLYPLTLKVVEWCRDLKPALSVGLGGPHVSYLDGECFKDSSGVDWVVRGEGEWTLLELLETIKQGGDLSKVRGITFRRGEEIVSTPLRPPGDVTELPPLDYSLLPEGFVRSTQVSIVASRGCAYRCAYCNESRFWGRRVRRVPVERVVDEIRTLADRYDNHAVGLEDSMFHMKSSYFYDLMKRIEGLRLNPGFYLLSRVDTVTDDGFRAMKRAGIKNLVLGIESASPRVLAMMRKGIDMEQIVGALEGAARSGLTTGTFWIVGHPGDSMKESEITLESIDAFYRRGLMQTSEIALFVPYPGTDIFEAPERFGVRILTFEWERWGRFNTEPVCELEDFSREEIVEVWRCATAIAARWRHYRAMEREVLSLQGAEKPGLVYAGVGRNEPCPCGSGKKFKRCCGAA